MKTTSKKAYNKGQIEFWIHRNRIIEAMKDRVPRTYKQIAKKIVMRDEQVWKRVSELEGEGVLIDVGEIDVNGKPNTLYQFNFENKPCTKKISFNQFLNEKVKERHIAIYQTIEHEYETLILHKL